MDCDPQNPEISPPGRVHKLCCVIGGFSLGKPPFKDLVSVVLGMEINGNVGEVQLVPLDRLDFEIAVDIDVPS